MYFESAAGKGTAGSPVGLNDKNQAHENQWFNPNASSPCDFVKPAKRRWSKIFPAKSRMITVGTSSEAYHFTTRSRPISVALYIPGYSEKHNVYTKYHLNENQSRIAHSHFIKERTECNKLPAIVIGIAAI